MLRVPALTLTLAVLPAMAFATPEGWKPLLEPTELAVIAAQTPELRIVHVTGAADGPVIAGAVFSPYAKWRAGPTNPGAILPEMEYEIEITRLGIDADTPVVIVHAGTDASDMGAAARVYWTLKSVGVQDLALLNGGFAAWTEAGLPVAATAATLTESDFEANWDNTWSITTAEVAALSASGDARLLDSRPQGFFEGLQWSIARPGTIRGAENLQFGSFFDGKRMVSPERAAEIVAAKGITGDRDLVSFCNTGHWAALNWFALSELAGVDGVRLYAASMAEYTQNGHALDNEPNRVQYLWRSTKKWVEGLLS
ncbi:MAG: sulfurtransferase [Roseinatronobacter sp.]